MTEVYFKNPRHRPLGTDGATSSNVIFLGRKAITSGVINLYGCTSIVVFNDICLWISHSFENPSFISGDEVFDRDVLQALRKGEYGKKRVTDTDPANWHNVGLIDLVEPQCLIGKDQKAFIITPRPRTSNPDAAPSGTLMYGDRVAQIKDLLRELTPNATIHISDYAPRWPDKIYETSQGQFFDNLYGKVIFKYDPIKCFKSDPAGGGGMVPIAGMQLSVEDNIIYEGEWRNHYHQLVLEEGDLGQE